MILIESTEVRRPDLSADGPHLHQITIHTQFSFHKGIFASCLLSFGPQLHALHILVTSQDCEKCSHVHRHNSISQFQSFVLFLCILCVCEVVLFISY